jgi:hypothetical protein
MGRQGGCGTRYRQSTSSGFCRFTPSAPPHWFGRVGHVDRPYQWRAHLSRPVQSAGLRGRDRDCPRQKRRRSKAFATEILLAQVTRRNVRLTGQKSELCQWLALQPRFAADKDSLPIDSGGAVCIHQTRLRVNLLTGGLRAGLIARDAARSSRGGSGRILFRIARRV